MYWIKIEKIPQSGTGFIFSFRVDSTRNFPVIVTNKHVIQNGFAFNLSFTRKGTQNSPLFGMFDKITIPARDVKWTSHPKNLDIAITPLMPILARLPKGRDGYVYHEILEGDIPSQNELVELKGVEDILMIGYPIGIWDAQNNMPITRKGITATHPILNYQNRPEFVIDAACFPGSSGSPVLIVNEGTYSTRNGVRMGRRRLFMGVLYAGPNYQPDGEIKIIEIPTSTRMDAITIFKIPLNLGYVIKSSALLDFKTLLGIK